MSNLVDLYENSKKKRVEEAREIPSRETDYFDREKEFATGFKAGKKKLDPTDYTEKGLDQYNEDRNDLTPPESFDASQPLHRYTPETPFYDPGAPDSSAT